MSVVVSGACQGRDRRGADSGRMRNSAIAVSGLRKAYGDKTVLDGIDLDVPAGTVFSLPGPNGAGKTTTVNVLTTLMKADGGTVRVAGHDVATETSQVRAVIGVTGQFAAVDDLLTGEENRQLMADLHHLRAARASGWSPRCWNGSIWWSRHRRWRSPIPAVGAGSWIWR